MKTELLVDPEVSRAKFAREVGAFRANEPDYRRRGWFMLRAEFPTVEVLMCAPQLKPAPALFTAHLDFSNYDIWPPSVRIQNPFTGSAFLYKEAPKFFRAPTPPMPEVGGVVSIPVPQDLLQAHSPDDVPFFCIPGVREYHDHPAHSGDPWLLHRGTGVGGLHFLLDKLHQYGVTGIKSYNASLQFRVDGFAYGGLPP